MQFPDRARWYEAKFAADDMPDWNPGRFVSIEQEAPGGCGRVGLLLVRVRLCGTKVARVCLCQLERVLQVIWQRADETQLLECSASSPTAQHDTPTPSQLLTA